MRKMILRITTFGWKHGEPPEADEIIDVRCLINPFWEPSLRSKTGQTPEVQAYILSRNGEIVDKLTEFLALQAELLEKKRRLRLAIGCTGGRHRSVAVATALGEHLRCMDYNAANINRDLNKGG